MVEARVNGVLFYVSEGRCLTDITLIWLNWMNRPDGTWQPASLWVEDEKVKVQGDGATYSYEQFEWRYEP